MESVGISPGDAMAQQPAKRLKMDGRLSPSTGILVRESSVSSPPTSSPLQVPSVTSNTSSLLPAPSFILPPSSVPRPSPSSTPNAAAPVATMAASPANAFSPAHIPSPAPTRSPAPAAPSPAPSPAPTSSTIAPLSSSSVDASSGATSSPSPASVAAVLAHVDSLAGFKGPIQCPYCDTVLARHCTLRRHIDSKHMNKRLKCTICQGSVKWRQDFNKHMKSHGITSDFKKYMEEIVEENPSKPVTTEKWMNRKSNVNPGNAVIIRPGGGSKTSTPTKNVGDPASNSSSRAPSVDSSSHDVVPASPASLAGVATPSQFQQMSSFVPQQNVYSHASTDLQQQQVLLGFPAGTNAGSNGLQMPYQYIPIQGVPAAAAAAAAGPPAAAPTPPSNSQTIFYQCSLCQATFPSRDAFDRHAAEAHGQQTIKQPPPPPPSAETNNNFNGNVNKNVDHVDSDTGNSEQKRTELTTPTSADAFPLTSTVLVPSSTSASASLTPFLSNTLQYSIHPTPQQPGQYAIQMPYQLHPTFQLQQSMYPNDSQRVASPQLATAAVAPPMTTTDAATSVRDGSRSPLPSTPSPTARAEGSSSGNVEGSYLSRFTTIDWTNSLGLVSTPVDTSKSSPVSLAPAGKNGPVTSFGNSSAGNAPWSPTTSINSNNSYVCRAFSSPVPSTPPAYSSNAQHGGANTPSASASRASLFATPIRMTPAAVVSGAVANKCSKCSRTFTNKRSLRMHFKAQHTERRIFCNLCDQDFKYNSSCTYHLRKQHNIHDNFGEYKRVEGDNSDDEEAMFHDDSFLEEGASSSSFPYPSRAASPYSERSCASPTSSAFDVEEEEEIDCRECGSTHQRQSHQCHHCHRTFRCTSHWEVHLWEMHRSRTHSQPPAAVPSSSSSSSSSSRRCSSCRMTFNCLDSLRLHRRLSHSLFDCRLCPESFGDQKRLDDHFLSAHPRQLSSLPTLSSTSSSSLQPPCSSSSSSVLPTDGSTIFSPAATAILESSGVDVEDAVRFSFRFDQMPPMTPMDSVAPATAAVVAQQRQPRAEASHVKNGADVKIEMDATTTASATADVASSVDVIKSPIANPLSSWMTTAMPIVLSPPQMQVAAVHPQQLPISQSSASSSSSSTPVSSVGTTTTTAAANADANGGVIAGSTLGSGLTIVASNPLPPFAPAATPNVPWPAAMFSPTGGFLSPPSVVAMPAPSGATATASVVESDTNDATAEAASSTAAAPAVTPSSWILVGGGGTFQPLQSIPPPSSTARGGDDADAAAETSKGSATANESAAEPAPPKSPVDILAAAFLQSSESMDDGDIDADLAEMMRLHGAGLDFGGGDAGEEDVDAAEESMVESVAETTSNADAEVVTSSVPTSSSKKRGKSSGKSSNNNNNNNNSNINNKEKGSFPCDQCNKVYQYRTTLKLHVEFVHEKKGFRCETCDKIFARADFLREHEEEVHQKMKFPCELCGETFDRKRIWRTHFPNVHGLTPKQALNKIAAMKKRREEAA